MGLEFYKSLWLTYRFLDFDGFSSEFWGHFDVSLLMYINHFAYVIRLEEVDPIDCLECF